MFVCFVFTRSLLFVVYASKLFTIIKKHLPNVHCFADDTQLSLSFKSDDKSNLDEAISAMNRCIRDLRNWMIRDRLMIKDDKTELKNACTSSRTIQKCQAGYILISIYLFPHKMQSFASTQ